MYILRYNREVVQAAFESGAPIGEEGIDSAFDVVHEITEAVRTCIWVGDCLLYTSSNGRLNYTIGSEVSASAMPSQCRCTRASAVTKMAVAIAGFLRMLEKVPFQCHPLPVPHFSRTILSAPPRVLLHRSSLCSTSTGRCTSLATSRRTTAST